MSKKCYRYFGGLLQKQEDWLNKMAEQGYRLIRVDKMLYEFENCNPSRVEYRVEYICSKSQNDSQEYFQFLEDMGYKVFFKNINLNYSIGKVRYRPWAEKGGRIATNNTTFNKELLIVEKEKDGKPFDLHTSFEDEIQYYESLRKPYIIYFFLFLLIGVLTKVLLFSLLGLIPLVPALIYHYQIRTLKKEVMSKEW
ncbi:MAG: DUF2812 domain-containing protein [Oscillospiraceae bacterium]|jgi:hypothetical protein|nr:MAG: DUF2812 domain-containing protein [Oscillospiraceae bacterium]